MKRPLKTVYERIEQKNRLFAKFAGPHSSSTSDRNKARIFRVLFDRDRAQRRA